MENEIILKSFKYLECFRTFPTLIKILLIKAKQNHSNINEQNHMKKIEPYFALRNNRQKSLRRHLLT